MSFSVNRATDENAKENDVNKKLQIFGIFYAFQAGKVPSNEQIDIALNSLSASRALSYPSSDLSPESLDIISDLKAIVEHAKVLLLTKNQGDLLQEFIWHAQHIHTRKKSMPGASADPSSGKAHATEALEGIRTLGTLIISNGQFRKLLKDTTILLREIAGDAAQNVANIINPSKEEIMQLDDPAESSTWHEIPEISGGKIKETLRSSTSGRKAFSIGDRSGLATSSSNTKTDSIQDESGFNVRISGGHDATDASEDSSQDKSEKKTEALGHLDQTKNYLANKIPVQRRELTVLRIKRLIIECQAHPDYHKAVTTLLNLAETYAGQLNKLGEKGTSMIKGTYSGRALKSAQTDLKILIERFANGTSTDDLFASINSIYSDADKDPELRSWLKDVNVYFRKCLETEGYVMDALSPDEWDSLFDKGNYLLRDRYRHLTDRFVGEVKFLSDQFDQDPMNKSFSKVVEKFFNDLGKDANGKPAFKPQLLRDLIEIILPSLFENIKYVPIPRIEYSDSNIDLVIENLVIESDNFFPNTFEVTNDNYFQWGRKRSTNSSKHSVSLHISGVQMDLKDVSYYLNKKNGFPSIKDLGIFDIFLGGSGFSLTIKMSTCDTKDRQNFFKIDQVKVDIKNLKIKIKESKHKVLLAIVKPILLRTIRPVMQNALEKNIRSKALWLDSLLYQIKSESDDATEEAKTDPEKMKGIYHYYISAARNKIRNSTSRPERYTAAGTIVNMAITEHDFIFPHIQLPGGISSKALMYKQLALNSDNWESPVFNLGTAATSKRIPKAPNVMHKEHLVTSDNNDAS